MSSADGPLALDLDGTLIDAKRRQLAVIAALIEAAGEAVPDLEAWWQRKREGEATGEALAALGLESQRARELAAAWVAQVEDEAWLGEDRPLPGVEAELADLAAAGERPLILTARRHPDRVRAQVAALGLDRWCEGPRVVDPGAAAEEKAAALRALGARAYVGDTESDARAATLAEVRFAAVDTGQRSGAFLAARGLEPFPSLGAALRALDWTRD